MYFILTSLVIVSVSYAIERFVLKVRFGLFALLFWLFVFQFGLIFAIDALLQNMSAYLPDWLTALATTLGGFAFVTIGITPLITLVLAAAYLLFALGNWLFDRDDKDDIDVPSRFTIAIDGPAASGKGTLARRIADYYGYHHLDTGLTYRAVAKALLDENMALDDEFLAEKAARSIDLSKLDRTALSTHEVGEAASKVAVMPAVRRALVASQQAFAQRSPGTVLDGRDIGTVVCPDAPVKLYITASPEARAKRRFEEIKSTDGSVQYEEILADLTRRDARDMGRTDSPLKPAADAHLLDTTEMDIETAFLAAKKLIDQALVGSTH
ncbi:cytidylate kinase [Phyllobacterium myrsinacearum]|uniref:Cytidylate kinase n=1 Tax=Phyllobacterium myrsinacearum TaxID=28101 RepID=A0A839EG56_9HYPH|nr:cytidylate kinase [Phyllobacterium myrsinacearum]